MSSLSSQKGKEFIKELQELGESEERNEAPTAALSAYEDALSVAIEIGAVEKIPILASCCSRLCFHTKNYTQSIGFANICTYYDRYFQEAFWWMYKSNEGNKDHKNALKCLVCGFNAASEEASQKKFLLELAVRIPDLLPSVENREILKGLSNPTEDEAFLVSTLEQLSIDGRWLAVSLLVTGYHLGPRSCLDNCAHNCVAKSLSVGRLLKCLNAEELKTWGMYLAVALLKNKATFETVEECFASPVLHVGVKLALTTGITGLVELMIKHFRKRSKKLREKDNDGKTAYQFLTKCTDPLSQTYTRLESLLKNICHKEEGAKAETDILSRRPDTKTNTNDMCCEYKKIATDLFQEGRYSKAILKYKKSISYTTDRKMLGILYGNIAECCLKLRQFQDAEKYGQESIKNDQSLTKSYVRVGRAMSNMERYEEAIHWFLTALRKDQSFDKRASILTYYTATAVKMEEVALPLHVEPSLWTHTAYLSIVNGNWDASRFAFFYSEVSPNESVYTLRPFYNLSLLRENDWAMTFIENLVNNGSQISSFAEGTDESFLHIYFKMVLTTGVPLKDTFTTIVRKEVMANEKIMFDSDGNTLFHLIIRQGGDKPELQKELCKELINVGMSQYLDHRNKEGKVATAYVKRNPELKKILENKKSKYSTAVKSSKTKKQFGGTVRYQRKQANVPSCIPTKTTRKRKQSDKSTCEKCEAFQEISKQLQEHKDGDGALSDIIDILEHSCKRTNPSSVQHDAIKCIVDHTVTYGMKFLPKHIEKIKSHNMENIVKEFKDRRMWFNILHVITCYNGKRGTRQIFRIQLLTNICDVLHDTKDQKEGDVIDLVLFMLESGATIDKGGREEIKLVLDAKMYSLFAVLIQKGEDEMMFFTTLSTILSSHSITDDLTTLEILLHAKKWPDSLRNRSHETVFHILCKEDCSDHILKLFLCYGFLPTLRDSRGKLPIEYLKADDKRKILLQETMPNNIVLTMDDIENNIPQTTEELQHDLQKLVNNLKDKESIAKDSYQRDDNEIRRSHSKKEEGQVLPKDSYQRDDNEIRRIHSKKEESQVLPLVDSKFDYDSLGWDVECTKHVWKMLTKNDFPFHLKRKALDVINKLANGEFQHGKRLKTTEILKLYESDLDDGARIIWEKALAFSPKKTKYSTMDNNLYSIKHVYCDVIRIWDIVIDHDNLKRAIGNIQESCKKGRSCNLKKKLKLDEGIKSVKICDRAYSRNVVSKTPRFYFETEENLDVENLKELFHPASLEEKQCHIFKFYSFSTCLANNILKKVSDIIDFPFKETPTEFSVISLPSDSPILLLGRSGTGKTTCCLYRLWNDLCFHSSWSHQIRGNETTEQGNRTDYTDEDAEFNQIFVTKNSVLCAEVEKRFREFCRAEPMTIHLSNESSSRLPNSLKDVRKEQFPLFLTSRQFLLLLDETLGPDYFFERNDSGSLASNIKGWTVSDRTEINTLSTEGEDDDSEISTDEEDESEEAHPGQKDNLTKNMRRCVNKRGKKDGKTRASFSEKREVTYDVFEYEIWPCIKRSDDKTHPSAIWTEFMSFIEGSFESFRDRKGFLSREQYVEDIGKKRAPTFSHDRNVVYDYFKEYEEYKMKQNLFDEIDVVKNILHRYLRQKNEIKWKIHKIYVDETQDFTQAELWLFLILLEDPNHIFCTGDTAQGIMQGISFRFEELKTLFYKLGENCKRRKSPLHVEVPKLLKLPYNYRSHDGIIRLASSVLDILWKYFPMSFDKVEECGMFPGPVPVIIESRWPDDLLLLLRGNIRKTTSTIEFGAHQAILVRDEKARDDIPKEFQNSLILTVAESKGLEFDDVLLYNFFKDSQANEEWRLANNYLKHLSEMDRETRSVYDKDIGDDTEFQRVIKEEDAKRKKVIQTELKLLYTAMTRARVHFWIFDEDEEKRKPMFGYFLKRKLVRILDLDAMETTKLEDCLVEEKSSTDEWMLRGESFLKMDRFKLASKCFLKGGNLYKAMVACALSYASLAKRHIHDISKKRVLYLKAAHICLSIGLPNRAVKNLIEAKEHLVLAHLYEKKGKFAKAGREYLELNQTDDFIRNFLAAWRFKDAVNILRRRNLYTQAKDVFRKYKECIRQRGKEIPDKLVKNRPETDIQELSYSEATYWCMKGDDDAMLKALNDIENEDDVVQFLSEHHKVEEAVTILKRTGRHERVVQEYLKHGQTEEAIRYSKSLDNSELLSRCYIMDSHIMGETGAAKSKSIHLDDLVNLRLAFDFLKDKNNDLAGDSIFLLGQMTRDHSLIVQSFEQYKTALPVENKAGMLKCMDWMIENADISRPDKLREIIIGVEISFEVLLVLATANNKEQLNKIYNQFGLFGRTNKLEYFPKQIPPILRCLGEKSSNIDKVICSITKEKAKREIFNYLAVRTKKWHGKLFKTLMDYREKLLFRYSVQRKTPFKSNHVQPQKCDRIHSQSPTQSQLTDLICIDLFLFQLHYVMYAGSKTIQRLHLSNSYSKFESEHMRDFHSSLCYLLGDLISSLQCCKNDQSMITLFRLYLKNEKKASDFVNLQNAPDVKYIRRGIKSLFTNSDIDLNRGNSTVFFMNIFILFYMIEGLFGNLTNPLNILECYEEEIRKRYNCMPTNKAMCELRALGIEFSLHDRKEIIIKSPRVSHFYMAMYYLYDNEEPVMAFMEFTKFVRDEGRNMSSMAYPDLSDFFLLFEYFTTFIMFALSKDSRVKENVARRIFLPMTYKERIDILNSLLCQQSRERYQLEDLVAKSCIRDIEQIKKSFSSIVKFVCAKKTGLLTFLLENTDFAETDTFLPRCFILLETWLCNAGHILPVSIETTILHSFRFPMPPHPLPSAIQKMIEALNIAKNQQDIGALLQEYLSDCCTVDRLVVYEWDIDTGITENTENCEIHLKKDPFMQPTLERKSEDLGDEEDLQGNQDQDPYSENDIRQLNQKKEKVRRKLLFMLMIKYPKKQINQQWLKEQTEWFSEMFSDIKINEEYCGVCGVKYEKQISSTYEDGLSDLITDVESNEGKPMNEKDEHSSTETHKGKWRNFLEFIEIFKTDVFDRYFEASFAYENYKTPVNGYLMREFGFLISQFQRHTRETDYLVSSIIENRDWLRYTELVEAVKILNTSAKDMVTKVRAAIKKRKKETKKNKVNQDQTIHERNNDNEEKDFGCKEDFPELPAILPQGGNKTSNRSYQQGQQAWQSNVNWRQNFKNTES